MRCWALKLAQDWVCSCWTVALPSIPTYDRFLVEKCIVAFAISCGPCQNTPLSLEMMSVELPEHYHPFTVEHLREPLNRMYCTFKLIHVSSRIYPPIPVVSIRRAASASAEISPRTAVSFWWLCLSPSWGCHLRSVGPTLSLHCPHLRNLPHCQNLQDHSDVLR